MPTATFKATMREIFPTQTREYNGKPYSDKVFHVETLEQYPTHLQVNANSKTINLIDALNIGDEVEMSINVKGSLYQKNGENKIFNKNECFFIKKIEPQQQYATPQRTNVYLHDNQDNNM